MKKKMVLKVCMPCEKCKKKAMKIAAETEGVNSVALDEKIDDRLVVIGDGVDSVRLTGKLRKKLGQADIVELGEKKEEKKDDKKDAKKDDKKDPQTITYYCSPYPPLVTCEYEPSPSICCIL